MRPVPIAADRIWPVLAFALVGISIVFRCYALGRLPGINGDEAWYGVQALRLASGTAEWRTPSGNLPGPLHLGTLFALHQMFSPSFTLLRVPSLLASFGAMAMAYAIGLRYFDRRTALTLLLLTAALPADIAYARFGWDPSWNVLVNLGGTWFALAGNPLGTAMLFLLALAVHPTNLFVAPFLLLTLTGTVWQKAGRQAAIDHTVRLTILMLAAIAFLPIIAPVGRTEMRYEFPDSIINPAHWLTFALYYGRLLSGDTVYIAIVGQSLRSARAPADVVGLVLLFGMTASSLYLAVRKNAWREAGTAAGWLASLAAFYLIAGTNAIRPGPDRYALCLLAPSLLAIIALGRLLAQRLLLPAVCILAALLLAGFANRYFGVLLRTGSESEQAFWTGAAEPKQDAFRRIFAEAAPRGGARVVAEDYWLRWPLAYLAFGTTLAVSQAGEPAGKPAPGGTYQVSFAGSAYDRAVAASERARLRWTIAGTARPAILHVWWTPPGAHSP